MSEELDNSINKEIDNLFSVIFHPKQFFSKLKEDSGYKNSIFFIMFIVAIRTLEIIIYPMTKTINPISIGSSIAEMIGSFIGGLFLLTIICLIGLSIITMIYYILIKIVGGKGNYNSTFQVLSYSLAPSIFIIIPYIGFLFGLYIYYLHLVGFSKIHNLSLIKSSIPIIMINIPLVLIFLIFA